MKTQPKVSILIPIYNVEQYLKQCLDSVVSQTLKDIEIILLDDGSKDNCPRIIDEYAAKDNRIKVVHKPNSGYGATMNIGLRMANGEYIGIVEPDDWIEPNMYKALYAAAQKHQADVVKSGFTDYKDLKQKEITHILNKNLPIDCCFTVYDNAWILDGHPSIWSAIYRNEFIKSNNICFIEAPGSAWTDNPFFLQTTCLAQRIVYLPEFYYYWRQTTKTDSEALKNYCWPFDRCQEMENWLKQQKITDSSIWEELYIREIGYVTIVLGMKKIKNIKDCRKKIRQLCSRIDADIVQNSKNFPKKYKQCFFAFLKKPTFSFYQYRYNLFPKTIIEKIFSFKNSQNKKYKVLTILGLQLKFRRW